MTLLTCTILSSVLVVSCYFCFFASFSDEQNTLLGDDDRFQELYDSLSTGQKMFPVVASLGILLFFLSIVVAFTTWLFS